MFTALRPNFSQSRSFLVQCSLDRQWRCFAGHNKWSKIKRKKWAKDAARAGLFAKASRAIIAASKACGGDMDNLQLQSAIQHAKSIQLSQDRIQAAIDKYLENEKGGNAFQTKRYDAMITLDGTKVACILIALTDNAKRTAASVRAAVVRANGELLPTSAHDFMFNHVGVVFLEWREDMDEDGLWECALEAGATEVEIDSNSAIVSCEPQDLWALVRSLQDNGYKAAEFRHQYMLADPESALSLSTEGHEKLEAFMVKMDDNEDVTDIYYNTKLEDDGAM
mmetsp:Transcript_8618/g.13283  ORF Transcript_8618/g.13283 Transcript_8618/m.13283 type:complete len:280 (+) Transcript_8618:130-969(+)